MLMNGHVRYQNGIDNLLPWLCVMCSDFAPDPLEPFVFGSSCIYIFVSLFTCKYCIVILYIFVLYTGCNYIIFSLFVFIFFFSWSWGVWLLQAYIFSIYSLTSTGIKGILLLRCLTCILTLRICFMSAAGVVDYNLYMQAGDSWLCELIYELLLRHFCWCASIGGNSIGKERKGKEWLHSRFRQTSDKRLCNCLPNVSSKTSNNPAAMQTLVRCFLQKFVKCLFLQIMFVRC